MPGRLPKRTVVYAALGAGILDRQERQPCSNTEPARPLRPLQKSINESAAQSRSLRYLPDLYHFELTVAAVA